jgi:predicted enzyme related to lactoylglutathione lyase
MNRVVHFEIHAKDKERMQKFYSDAFGWTMQKMGPEMDSYIVVTTGGDSRPDDPKTWGINGGITTRVGDLPKDNQPVNAYLCYIGVNDIDDAIDKVKSAGGSITHDKMDEPDVGKIAYAKDPEGNIFGILEPNPPMAK